MIRRALAALDEAVHWLETRLIAVALSVMSVTVFMDVLHRRLSDPDSKLGDALGLIVGDVLGRTLAPPLSLLLVIGLARWVSGSRRGALALTAALYGFGELVVRAPSVVVYAVVLAGLAGAMMWRLGGLTDGVARLRGGLALALELGAAGLGVAQIPQGYSWAQNFSLFLLLWVGFLGASVATRGRRHIQVDAFRKYVPERSLAWYNAASLMVAAAFSGFLLWIAFLYTFGAEGNIHHVPDIGRVPDWLVTASLPVAFGIMTVRFGAQTVQEVEAARAGRPSPLGRHDEGMH